jgi:hypothetical protein
MEQLPASIELRENYLLVTGFGERTQLSSIVDASEKINEEIVRFQNKYLLLDYSRVNFNIPVSNAFDLVRIYESKMPELKSLTVAVVFSQLNRKIGEYWRDISRQRGFNLMVFYDFVQAELWLLEQREKD